MKVRKFYPTSVLRKLDGKARAVLSAGEQAALAFAMRKGRKLGVQVIMAHSELADFEKAPLDVAAAVIANCNLKVALKFAQRK